MVGLGKTYAATVRLGQSTTTDDALGAVIATTPAAGLTPEQVEMALAPLRGEISQVPSAVSAIKVDGRRAYARVRAGETVELKPRLVTVSRLEITARRVVGEFTDLDLVVECSSGTYVRALARDLGQNLAVGGHLTALRRLAVGPFLVAGAFTLEQLEADFRVLDLGAAARLLFPVRELVPEQVEALRHGRFVAAGAPGLAAALAPDGALVAMVRSDTSTGQARPEAVFV
jgi:tRNA pseudouridine55 synthase